MKKTMYEKQNSFIRNQDVSIHYTTSNKTYAFNSLKGDIIWLKHL